MDQTGAEPDKSLSSQRFSINITRGDIARWEMFILGIVFGALLLAAVQTYTGFGIPPSAPGNHPAGVAGADRPQPTEVLVDTSQLTIRDANTKGPENAPVTIYEFSDFQCPFCRRAFETTIPSILEQYVAQGKVRFVYKNYAILGQESIWAAEAAECAADQGKFWEYHDKLFRQAGIAGAENVGAFAKDNLIKYAEGLKLDMSTFTPCIENDTTRPRVDADLQEGQALQVAATPTFFINNTRLVGAKAWPAFLSAINTALNP